MKNEDELLAGFIGGTKQIIGSDRMYGYNPGTIIWRGLFDEDGITTYLDFKSWEWIMYVINKIDKLILSDGSYFRTNINGCKK